MEDTTKFERERLLYPLSEDQESLFDQLNNKFCLSILAPLTNECLEKNIKENIISSQDYHKEWFCAGVSALLYFIQNNFTGVFDQRDIDYLLPLRKTAISEISITDPCSENVQKPELLLLARAILCNNVLQGFFPSCLWWAIRVNYVHQLILDEGVGSLYEDSERLIRLVLETDIIKEPALETLFHTEVTYVYLYYNRIQSSEKYLEDARTIAKLNLELDGAMGKRTKYQQQEKAQLYLKAKPDKDPFPYRDCKTTCLPKVITLTDDLRLEKIEFSEATEYFELGALEEAIILAKFFQLKISQPKDQLTDEEIAPYLDFIVDTTENWALKVSALFQRCVLEANHKRTIERSLAQLEYLIEQLNATKTPLYNRFDLFFASGMLPVWTVKQRIANVMLNLGMVKTALDLFLKLALWEDVIVCYTILEMKNKAAEVIKQELEKKPTVKLWCLLGDAEIEAKHYETAWKLSGEKSSRAQRHWGYHYYFLQNYAEAVVHLKLSAELNSAQEMVWLRLGFAALQLEDWKLAASAYRKYCSLEQSSFEVWNNLAKAYIKLGDKPRAWRALQDAVKCNFDKWEVWDNLMIVSIDLRHFSEVIRCYHRILDLKGSHVDVQILSILVRSIINETKDSDKNSARLYLPKTLELFGRITANTTTDPDIWRLYAELTLLKNTDIDNQKAAQFMQRAYRAAVSNPRWFKTVEDANVVLDTCVRLAQATMKSMDNCAVAQKRAVLGSAKLNLQSVVKKMKDLMWEDQSGISENLAKVEHYLQVILDELEKLKDAQN